MKNIEWAEAFQIFSKYEEEATVVAEHDEVWVGPDKEKMSKEDIDRLEVIGWDLGEDDDGYGLHTFV